VIIPGHGQHLTGLGHVQDLAVAMANVLGKDVSHSINTVTACTVIAGTVFVAHNDVMHPAASRVYV
jgi:hypothetical protein